MSKSKAERKQTRPTLETARAGIRGRIARAKKNSARAVALPDATGAGRGWLTQAEAAKQLGISRERVRQLVNAGKLPTNGRRGRECRIDPADILRRMARLERGALVRQSASSGATGPAGRSR